MWPLQHNNNYDYDNVKDINGDNNDNVYYNHSKTDI